MQKFIVVRMEEGEEPSVKVYGRGSYYHTEQGITVPTGASLEVEAPEGLQELLEEVIREYGLAVDMEVQAAEITDAAAAQRAARKARRNA